MDERVRLQIETLRQQGHAVTACFVGDNPRYEIDGRMTISGKEMRELADGVYSLEELEDLLVRRLAEEDGAS
jgi:hypothetical protein